MANPAHYAVSVPRIICARQLPYGITAMAGALPSSLGKVSLEIVLENQDEIISLV